MTFRIRRMVGTQRTTFALCGELNGDHLAELDQMIAFEKPGDVVLDLADVTVATRQGVEFIRRTMAEGAQLVNCPAYIRRWIEAEQEE